ncbi:hypothetical protein GOODEAATRI_012986, partial [Goodea atripinnis]
LGELSAHFEARMDRRSHTTAVMSSNLLPAAGAALPLASLRLLASPLQLTYSYIWQVIRQRNVKHYCKVEEFVTMVTQTVPELLSFKQTAQLILGLRAREVFPVQYGVKFDTALQALIAGLVCKLEQLLPVPNLDSEDVGGFSDDAASPAPSVDAPQQEVPISHKSAAGNGAKEKAVRATVQSQNLEQDKSSEQQQQAATTPQSERKDGTPAASEKPELQQLPLKSIPFRVVQVPVKTASTLAKDNKKPQTHRVTLHQWVSQIATNSMSLPELPPLPPGRLSDDDDPRPSIRRKKQLRHLIDRFNCTVCDKSFPYQSKLMDHERIHTGEKPFQCSACNKSFRTQAFLNNHLKTHSTMRPYACGQCGKCFTKLQSLTKHILAHSGQKPFYCNICNKGFTQSTYFKRHMECHTSQMTFPCKHCSKTFPTAFKLSNHERWHTRDRPHMCERCGKRFLVPSLLKRHMGYHIGDRQYLCSQCGKTFVYLSDLKRHQQDHLPKTKIPCPVCQKKFSSKYCLRVHLRIHTRERPYRCPLCDKSFTQVGNLKVHIRLHTNERPFSCDVCGKTYKLASHLNVHKRTHSCKKPWTCETCGKGFTVPALLRKHEQIHIKEANPDFAGKRRVKGKHKKQSLNRKYDEEEEGSDDNY